MCTQLICWHAQPHSITSLCVSCHFGVLPCVHTCTVERVVNPDGPHPSQVTPADRLQRELLHTTAPYHVPSSVVGNKGASYEQRLQNMEYVLGSGGRYMEQPIVRMGGVRGRGEWGFMR